MFRSLVQNNEVALLQEAKDLFDPRKNTLWREPFLVPTYFSWLKTFWCRENLVAHPEAFLDDLLTYVHGGNGQAVIDAILAAVPDDKLWALNFFQFDGMNDRNHIHFYIFLPTWNEGSSTNFYWSCGDTLCRMNYSYAGSNFAAEFLERVDRVIAAYEPLFTAENNQRKLFHRSNFTKCCGPHQTLLLFHTGASFTVHQRNASPLNAVTFNDMLQDDPDLAIELQMQRSSPWRVQYNQVVTRTNRRAIHETLPYTTSPTSLLKWPLICKGEHKPILYGVELEVSADYSTKDMVEAAQEPFLIGKSDSSISGSKRNRVELVTIPMSLRRHKLEWAHWFSRLDYDRFDCTTQTTNGMHVHVDKTAFDSAQHLRNFVWFITRPGHKDFALALSERDLSSFQTYANVPTYNQSKTRSFIDCVNAAARLRGAVNVGTNKPTVEVRLFKGIVSYASVLKNLEAVDAILHFTRDKSFSQLTLHAFMAWLSSLPVNKYKVFRKFLDQIDMDEITYASRISEIIHGETEPEKILEKILKSGIHVNNRLVTLLNRQRGKRTFILNKETGALEVVIKNRAKLAPYDRILEKQYLPRTAA